MDNKANDTFAYDLENRLDDFFSDPVSNPDAPDATQQPPIAPHPRLKGLKSTILAIDWEITDDALASLRDQVEALKETFATHKAAHTLLRMLNALGQYLRVHKSNAHPDTTKRIMAVYAALENVVSDHALSSREQERLLLAEISAFRQLKQRIVASRPASPDAGSTRRSGVSDPSGIDAVVSAIRELQTGLVAELRAIRKALDQLRPS